MKYELSVKIDYVPNWGLKEAFREFVANARDAEFEMGAKSSVSWETRRGLQMVRIETAGVEMPREVLLFGHTTKYGNTELIGQFGEGLKLACLAAVRAGHDILIRCGSDVWTPTLEDSKVFPGTKVLVFNIAPGRKSQPRVVVEIHGVDEEQWNSLKAMFLHLRAPTKRVETSCGALLSDPETLGSIFVKGVLVEHDPRYGFGYDLKNAKVDRDRRIVDVWDVEYSLRQIWSEAAQKEPTLMQSLFENLLSEAKDTASISQYSAANLPEPVKEAIAAKFAEKYGQDAVPVANMGESQALEHLGRKGIVVPKGLQALVATKTGSVESVKAALREEVIKRYSWSDLSKEQQDILDRAVCIIGQVREISLDDVVVVDFRDPNLQGQWKDGKIVIAASQLASAKVTVLVLVHELAHKLSLDGDGGKSHLATIEAIWSDIVDELWLR